MIWQAHFFFLENDNTNKHICQYYHNHTIQPHISDCVIDYVDVTSNFAHFYLYLFVCVSMLYCFSVLILF